MSFFIFSLTLLGNHLSLRQVLVGAREALHVLLDQTVATQELNVGTILLELALVAELDVVLATDGGEAPACLQ